MYTIKIRKRFKHKILIYNVLATQGVGLLFSIFSLLLHNHTQCNSVKKNIPQIKSCFNFNEINVVSTYTQLIFNTNQRNK